MKSSEKFKPGTLIRPKKSLWSDGGLLSELSGKQSAFETGEILYRTHESEVGDIWIEGGYRYPLEWQNPAPKDWLHLLHKVTQDDVYMIVKAPTFHEIPKYFKKDYHDSGNGHPICFLSMMVSFGEHNWEIPIVVSQDSYLAYKLKHIELHKLFTDPDIWYSQIFEIVSQS